MFETSRSQKTWQGRLLFIETLPVSLGLHAVIILGILFATVWKVSFPTQSPKLYAAFQLADAAPPPPPPPPPPPAARPQQVTQQPVRMPEELVAPNVIPDAIPDVTNEPPPPAPMETGVVGGVEGGVEGGEVGGVIGGEIGGVITDTAPPPPPPPAPDGRVHVGRDEPLPLDAVKQDYPTYPWRAVKAGIEDRVIVRYVIGKDGRVKSVTILDKPMHEMFVGPTVEAIKGWRFKPMVVDGERQEVVHELTVNFRLNRGARGG